MCDLVITSVPQNLCSLRTLWCATSFHRKNWSSHLWRILHNSPRLYPHEHDVAAKALDEVKQMRHVFARGGYFEPMVHQVKETHELSGQKTEVKATFISIPVFCAMRNQEPEAEHHHDYGVLRKPLQSIFERTHRMVHEEEYSRTRHRDQASKEIRMRNDYLIRSLMQYANISRWTTREMDNKQS